MTRGSGGGGGSGFRRVFFSEANESLMTCGCPLSGKDMSLIADTCARSHAVCAPLFFLLMYLLAPASVSLVLPCEQVHSCGPATTGDAVLAVLGLAKWYCVTASTWVRLKEVFGVWCLVYRRVP